jgi:GlpG protein
MRSIGNLPDEAQARRFGDYLVVQGIRNEVEPDTGAAWVVWITEEDQVTAAQAGLERFRANPEAEEFRNARSAAAKARATEAEDMAAYRRRVRTRQSLFPKLGGYGVGPLTFSLIFLCVAVAVYSKLGFDRESLKALLLADPENANGTFLPEVRAGQWWRLITPIFIHFGPLHLLFNLMWLYQLGCMIEARQGPFKLALLVAVTGIGPMLAQYVMSGPSYVGGMSGVVYGLAGYVWLRGKYDRASGLYLDAQSVQWLLIWLVVCYTGLLGRVANTAHLTGLIIGVVWGRVSAYFASSRPE